jgi:hypothetical protein
LKKKHLINLKTYRHSYLDVDLPMHVNKHPIHLVTKSLLNRKPCGQGRGTKRIYFYSLLVAWPLLERDKYPVVLQLQLVYYTQTISEQILCLHLRECALEQVFSAPRRAGSFFGAAT